MDKVIVVGSTEQKTIAKGDNAGNMYLSVTAKDGKKYNIFNSAFWNFFQDGFAVKLIGEQSGQYFNVSGAEPVKDAEVIKAARETPTETSPQELGMWWKELGECLRTGFIKSDVLRKFYLAQMYNVIGFQAGTPKPTEEVEPRDIPF